MKLGRNSLGDRNTLRKPKHGGIDHRVKFQSGDLDFLTLTFLKINVDFGLRRALRSPNEILPSFTSHNLPSGAAKPRYHRGNVACRRRALLRAE